jgi:hypothetical protein
VAATPGSLQLVTGEPLKHYQAPRVNLANPEVLAAVIPPIPDAPSFAHVRAVWPRTCDHRVRLPDDELAYTEAWCALRVHGDVDGAVFGLVGVVRSAKTPGLAGAALDDLPRLVAQSTQRADEALRFVISAGVRHDVAVELLGNAYVALGREADAYEIAREARSMTRVGCVMDLEKALVTADQTIAAHLDRLAVAGCATEVFAVRCRLDVPGAATCPDPPAPPSPESQVAAALQQWSGQTALAWQRAAARARDAMPMRGAEAVAVAALANALVDDCAPPAVAAVAAKATELRRRPDHDPKLDPHLGILVHATPAACAATHARHHMP